MRTIYFAVLGVMSCLHASVALAQGADEDAMVASNVCQGATSDVVRAPGGTISTTVGPYKIEGANGSVTISKGERNVAIVRTADSFDKCMNDVRKDIAAERKAKASQRKSDIFELSLSLSQTLSGGICLRGAAQFGLYSGDMSQGDGRVMDEQATYDRLDATENVLRQKAQDLFKRDFPFSLSNKVQFFRFVPGKSVPYFDSTTIAAANSLIASRLVGSEQVVGSMGRDIGVASTIAHWFAVLPNLVQMVSQRDPQRAYFIQPGVQQSQQCIIELYPDIARQVQSEFSAFGCDIQVPRLDMDPHSSAWRNAVDAVRSCIRAS